MAKNTDMVSSLKLKTDEWEEGLKRSKKALDSFSGKMQSAMKPLTSYVAGLASIGTALKVAKDAFNRSETAIDAWGETLEMGKSAYTTFLDTLNGGDWTNFFDNLTTAMNSAKELYGILDRMNSIEANNQYAIFKEQANLKALRYEKSKSTDPARIAQIDKEAELSINRLEGLLTQVTESKYEAAKGMASNTIESLYNSVAGAQISKEEAARIAESVIEGAQNARDAWAKEYKRLTEKGMTEKTFMYSTGGNWGGSSTELKGQFFDINKLNKEEQHIYRLAYAITEGETALQQAAAMFTTAAQSRQGMNTQLLEASEILRMQTKVGKGGGAASWMGGAIADRTLGMGVGNIGTMTIGKLQPTDDALKNFEEWVLANPPKMPVDAIQPTQAAMEHFSQWVKDNPPAPIEVPVVVDPLKELKTTAEGIAGAFGAASGAISQFASESEAAAAIAKSFTIASAVATLVAQFASIPKGAEIWSWIAGTIAGVGTLAGAVATLKGFGYADGGVVKGNHFAGDAVPIMANAGEIVLNASQQQALASNLSQGGGGGTMTLEIRGDKLVGAINNYGRGHGLGKVVFK